MRVWGWGPQTKQGPAGPSTEGEGREPSPILKPSPEGPPVDHIGVLQGLWVAFLRRARGPIPQSPEPPVPMDAVPLDLAMLCEDCGMVSYRTVSKTCRVCGSLATWPIKTILEPSSEDYITKVVRKYFDE